MKYITLLISITLLYSCTSTKQLDTTNSTIEHNQSVNVDSLVKTKVDSVVRRYEELLKSLDADIIFYNDCDSAYIDTGSVKIVNTIKYVAGKGIEASGNIKSFKLRESQLLKLLEESTVQTESEINLRIKAEDDLKAEKESRKLDKKTKVFNLWWLLIVGYVLGWLFPPQKWIGKLKALISKLK